jgi:hypothetical protein
VPGVVPLATVITPVAAFMVIEPAAGVGAVPGVRSAFGVAPVMTTGTPPLVVSLATTDGVTPPVAGMAGGVSFTAKMVAVTVTTTNAVSQVAGTDAGKVQIV